MTDINKHHPVTDSNTAAEMPRYISHKRVWALELDTIVGHHLTFRNKRYAAMQAPEEMFSRYLPSPGDFYVVYVDGYKSFSPRKAFLEGYKAEAA